MLGTALRSAGARDRWRAQRVCGQAGRAPREPRRAHQALSSQGRRQGPADRTRADAPLRAPKVRARSAMPMRYLIAGGAGFIGSHLAEALLARGDEVLAL